MTRVINYAKLRPPQPAIGLYLFGGANLSPAPHASPTVDLHQLWRLGGDVSLPHS